MKRACVIGWPVEHSRSPVIHRYWLKLYGLEGAYEKEAVQPEELEGFLRTLGDRELCGRQCDAAPQGGRFGLGGERRSSRRGDRRGEHALAR